MTDRIFDQRLEDHRRDEGIEQRLFNFLLHGKAVCESQELDLKIAVNKEQLFAQRDFLDAGAIERQPHEFAQAGNHGRRLFRIVPDEHRNAVQSIEKEVRLDLRFENLELRLGQF